MEEWPLNGLKKTLTQPLFANKTVDTTTTKYMRQLALLLVLFCNLSLHIHIGVS